MASIGFEALAVFLVLLPGFLTAGIVRSLCVRPSQTDFDKIIEALLYSFLVYVIFVSIFRRNPLGVFDVAQLNGTRVYASAIEPKDVPWLFLISLALGLLLSASITNDLHGKVLRAVHFTQRSARPSIWNDVFHDFDSYVQIEFSDGRKLIGFPSYFSDTPEEASLFLQNAAWVDRDGQEQEIDGPGILITKNMPIQAIMFLNGQLDESESRPAMPSPSK